MIDQGEFFDIPNPCIGICTVNNKGYCKGCLRNRQERFHWNDLTSFQKQLVINLCHKRRQKILAGPATRVIEEESVEYSPQSDLFETQGQSQPDAKAVKAKEVLDTETRENKTVEKATDDKAVDEHSDPNQPAPETCSHPRDQKPLEGDDQLGLF